MPRNVPPGQPTPPQMLMMEALQAKLMNDAYKTHRNKI